MVAMADLYATIILPEQVVTIPQETEINWHELIKLLTGIIYWSGVLLLTARFFLHPVSYTHLDVYKRQVTAQRDAAIATEKAAKAQYTMAKNGAEREDKMAAEALVNLSLIHI